MFENLTDRQKEILDFIVRYREDFGYPPTLREIGKYFQISSTFGVKRHLEALTKKGWLTVESNASRGISLNKSLPGYSTVTVQTDGDIPDFHQVPILGRVAAGSPITAIENYEGTILVDKKMLGNDDNHFALKVKGDSMIDDGIFEGDFVIVHPAQQAEHNQIVVAQLDGEATVKRLHHKSNEIKLIPANKNYQPIELNKFSEFSIIGRVVGVIRWFN